MASERRRQTVGVRDVADDLGVQPRTVRNWIRAGRIEAAQPAGEGGKYRVPAQEVDRLWSELKRKG